MIGIKIGAGILLFATLLYGISKNNRFERLFVKIKEAESGIDVALSKRYGTLTKMLDVTKGYAKYEQEVLIKTIQMRQNMPIGEKIETDYKIGKAAKNFVVLAEAYPQLKADTIFVRLQRSIVDSEEHLQASRRLYNANVSAFNQEIAVFPGNIIAVIKGLRPQPMYRTQVHQEETVPIDF